MKMRHEFLQHMTSGDIYAVQFGRQEEVAGSVGPIPRQELIADPSEYAINMTDEDNAWFNEGNEFRLLDTNEVLQLRNR
jgi:hypothetical protein